MMICIELYNPQRLMWRVEYPIRSSSSRTHCSEMSYSRWKKLRQFFCWVCRYELRDGKSKSVRIRWLLFSIRPSRNLSDCEWGIRRPSRGINHPAALAVSHRLQLVLIGSVQRLAFNIHSDLRTEVPIPKAPRKGCLGLFHCCGPDTLGEILEDIRFHLC